MVQLLFVYIIIIYQKTPSKKKGNVTMVSSTIINKLNFKCQVQKLFNLRIKFIKRIVVYSVSEKIGACLNILGGLS